MNPETQQLLDLLASDKWPEAAPAFFICSDSEEDKTNRADDILHFIGDDLHGKKVLDFGCGEGHVAQQASLTASVAVGYDLAPAGTLPWESEDKTLLTTHFEKVKVHAPYDLVIIYDVLDHCEDPVAALKEVASVCGPETKVFVRFHSWMSRHGAHLYKQLNKAWVHLVFTESELAGMGLKMDFVNKVELPMKTQGEWIAAGGFSIVENNTSRTPVEPFFMDGPVAARLSKNLGWFPDWQMSQAFNDYVLRRG